MRISCWLLTCAVVPILLVAGCGGGGGGGVSFTLAAIDPAVSDDLAGGDTVTITGTNFVSAEVVSVTFGGVAATNPVVLSETEMTVQTPPAPGGVPQSVTVVVTSTRGGTEQIDDGYTYASSGPNPLTISPASFTPTGAEDFTITGTNLGPLGGQSTVIFAGVGSVTGDVSANGQTLTGRAPVSNGVPPAGPITVTVDTGAATADVPGPVTYPFTGPLPMATGVPGQTQGNASQPVRLADGFAALCTCGLNGTWGDADDDIRIVRGPPNAVQILSVPPRGAPGTVVGFLSATNSVPAVLGPDAFCVYTIGAAAGPGYVLVTNARTAPVADIFAHPFINAAPIAALGPSRIGFMTAGMDTLFGPLAGGNLGDDLMVMDFNLALTPPAVTIAGGGAGRVPLAGHADVTPGLANFTIPFTADGDTVIVMGSGADAVPRNADDTFTSVILSAGTGFLRVGSPFLLGRPIALSATLFAAPGAGPNGTFGNNDDTLEVYSYGAVWTATTFSLGQAISFPAAVVPYARAGNGIVVVVAAPTAILVYTNPLQGSNTTIPFAGTALLASLGNGELVAFGPGFDLTVRTGDDVAFHIDGAAAQGAFSLVPNHFQAIALLTDADRAFAISPGGDGVFQTADDVFEVFQVRALGAARSATRLPISALPAARVMGTVPFVPIGPGWGLLQSTGTNTIWGDLDDQLILVDY